MEERKNKWSTKGVKKAIEHYLGKKGLPFVTLEIDDPTEEEKNRIASIAKREGYYAEPHGDNGVRIFAKAEGTAEEKTEVSAPSGSRDLLEVQEKKSV